MARRPAPSRRLPSLAGLALAGRGSPVFYRTVAAVRRDPSHSKGGVSGAGCEQPPLARPPDLQASHGHGHGP